MTRTMVTAHTPEHSVGPPAPLRLSDEGVAAISVQRHHCRAGNGKPLTRLQTAAEDCRQISNEFARYIARIASDGPDAKRLGQRRACFTKAPLSASMR